MGEVLALPRIDTSIPYTLTSSGSQADTIRIAEALLDAGILIGSDWTGHLSESIVAGLGRWLRRIGANGLRFFNLELFYTNDLDGYVLYSSGIDELVGRPPGVDRRHFAGVGGFGLTMEYMMDGTNGPAVVGGRIMALEEAYPGAGYAVMGLIDEISLHCVIGATPNWCLGAGDFYCTWAREGDEGEHEDGSPYGSEIVLPPRAQFLAEVPIEACTAKYNRALLHRAFREISRYSHMSAIIEMALLLDVALRSSGWRMNRETKSLNHVYEQSEMPAFCVRWNDDDSILRVVDVHSEEIYQSGAGWPTIENEYGESQTVVYLRGFHTGQEPAEYGSVLSAARDLKHTMRIIMAADNLLRLLDRNGERLMQMMTRGA